MDATKNIPENFVVGQLPQFYLYKQGGNESQLKRLKGYSVICLQGWAVISLEGRL